MRCYGTIERNQRNLRMCDRRTEWETVQRLGFRGERLTEEHPRRSEPVPQLGKTRSEKGFLHRNKDLSVFGQQGVESLSLLRTVDSESQIGTPHRLSVRDVGSHKHGAPNFHAGVCLTTDQARFTMDMRRVGECY